jgi:threonine/homoserine/homoserine lactone efflux protein
LGQGLKSGRRAAMAANFGIATGGMVHTLLAALGTWRAGRGASGGLRGDPLAGRRLSVVAGGGGAAVLALRGRGAGVPTSAVAGFWQGLMVNLLNPKVILFILAFLPQFVDPSRAILPQFLTLGVVFSLAD